MFLLLVVFAIALPWALPHPVQPAAELLKRQDLDVTVLQFALTLEHLENVFYQQGLKNFSQEEFLDFGLDAEDVQNFQLIAQDEAQHVQFLTEAIAAAGSQPVAECTYNFPSTDVASFLTLSTLLEGVGTSAYLGGVPLISNKDTLTAAGSMLVTEALHTSLQRAVIGVVPAANAFGTPLSATAVLSLAASFIVSCPDSNEPLPFTSFASLSMSEQQGCNSSPSQNSQMNTTAIASSPSSSTPAVTASTATANNPQCSSHKNATASTTQSSQSTAPFTNSTIAATASCGALSAGASVAFTAGSSIPPGSFVTFVSGLSVVSMMGEVNDVAISAMIPPGISGQSYVFVTSSDTQGKIDDAAVLFGPAVLEGKQIRVLVLSRPVLTFPSQSPWAVPPQMSNHQQRSLLRLYACSYKNQMNPCG